MEITRPNEHFFIRHATAAAILILSLLMILVVMIFWRSCKGWVYLAKFIDLL